MKQILGVFNSNQINRYNEMFTVRALESGLSQSWNSGLPSLLSHDSHRLIAWSHGLSLLIEPGLVRLTGVTMIPENDKEWKELTDAFYACITQRIEEVFAHHEAELKRLLGYHLRGDEQKLAPDCAALFGQDLAARAFPAIFRQADRDGLAPLRKLHSVGPGVFEKDGLILFAHPFFRRSLSRLNSLNNAFLRRLQDIAATHLDLDIRIALDPDMVGLASTLKEHVELEYWWGPRFNGDISMITPGVTKHVANDRQKLFHGISATEFWWYVQKNQRTFECEELRDIPSYGIGAHEYGCRFTHSIVGADREPSHLDGAIRLYDEAKMICRLSTDIKRVGKKGRYTKLWRVDGSISIQTWKDLLCHYYRDNNLVGEYLGGHKESEDISEDTHQDVKDNGLVAYVPPVMSAGHGVHISISYHSNEPCSDPRHIIVFDRFKEGDEDWQPYIEADTVELAKLLHRRGKQIKIPSEAVYVVFEDRVLNLPLVMHCGSEAVLHAEQTQDSIAILCEEWGKRDVFVVVACNIGVQYSDRSVYISLAGHPSDLCSWLRSDEAKLPRTTDDLGTWCELASKALNQRYPTANDKLRIGEILEKSGLLVFKRRFLDHDQYSLRWDDKKQAIVAELNVAREEIRTLVTSLDSHVSFMT